MSRIEEGHAGKAEEIVIHEHVLTPFQKLVCLVELIFVGWLLYVCNVTIASHVSHVIHLLH